MQAIAILEKELKYREEVAKTKRQNAQDLRGQATDCDRTAQSLENDAAAIKAALEVLRAIPQAKPIGESDG